MLFGGTQLETGSAEINELVANTRYVGNDEYHLADCLCHVLWRGYDGRRHAGQYHLCVYPFHQETYRDGVFYVASGLFLNLATADQYISIILTGNMFKDIYEANGYESRLLSRTTEDAVTVNLTAYPLEYLRYDSGNYSECAYTHLSSIFFL